MKFFFAISLLSVHVFNLVGYTFFFSLLQQQNAKQTVAYIDNKNYTDADLVLVKVPVQLPYSTNLADYERYDGEIEWGGVHYNYVKRKMANDTLYVLCLPNEHRTKLFNAEDKYSQQVNDAPGSKQKENGSTVKKATLPSEYDQPQSLVFFSGYLPIRVKQYAGLNSALMHTHLDGTLQPPEAAAS